MIKDRKPNGYWKSKDNVFEEAKKYSSKIEFQRNNQSAYWAALKYGYLEEMPWLVKNKVTPRGVLTKEYVMNEANKYSSMSEFRNSNKSAYDTAQRNGYLSEINLKRRNSKPSKYWNNKELVLEEGKKYTTKTEFKEKSNGAYASAIHNGWINEMTWFENGLKKRKRWKTKEDVFEESKKYSSRSEFQKKASHVYDIARTNKWLDEMTWLTNKNVYVDKVDSVYKYYFETENAVYIGRTVYKALRDRQHRTTLNDSVYKFAKKHNIEIPKMEIIEDNLTVLEGIEREKYWGQYYKDNGYTIINKASFGSIGPMASGKWSKEKCIEESKKYASRNEFFLHSNSAYQKSLKEGWIDEMTWLSNSHNYPRGYWKNKENVINEAKKYTSKKEFAINSNSAYLAAYRNGWINEMTWLVKQSQRPKNYWKNKENIINEAKRYTSRNEFKLKSPTAYTAARKYGYIEEIEWIKPNRNKPKIKAKPKEKHPKGYWKNRENIMNEARKYKTKEEFQRENLSAFLAAYRYGYIDDMYWLVRQKQHKNGYWTYEHIKEEAIKCDTKTEFSKKNATAYRAALKLGIIDDFFSFNNYVE